MSSSEPVYMLGGHGFPSFASSQQSKRREDLGQNAPIVAAVSADLVCAVHAAAVAVPLKQRPMDCS